MSVGDLVYGRGLYNGFGIVVEIDVGPERRVHVVYDDPGFGGIVDALHPRSLECERPSSPKRVEMTADLRSIVHTTIAIEVLRRIG